jgi:hypothetical protein
VPGRAGSIVSQRYWSHHRVTASHLHLARLTACAAESWHHCSTCSYSAFNRQIAKSIRPSGSTNGSTSPARAKRVRRAQICMKKRIKTRALRSKKLKTSNLDQISSKVVKKTRFATVFELREACFALFVATILCRDDFGVFWVSRAQLGGRMVVFDPETKIDSPREQVALRCKSARAKMSVMALAIAFGSVARFSRSSD